MASDLEAALEKPPLSVDGHHDEQSSEPDQTPIEKQSPVGQQTKDNIVDWDGPDDPQNPMNWPTWKRLIQVILASTFLLTA